VTTARKSVAAPARRPSASAAPTATSAKTRAARNATSGDSACPTSTRLPPENAVGDRLARSAARSK